MSGSIEMAGKSTDRQRAVEAEFVRAFFLPERQPRALQALPHPKRRSKFLGRLAHLRDLDEAYAARITAGQQTVDGIRRLLESHGAPEECQLMSEHARLDGRTMALADALEEIVAFYTGTIVICRPAQLAYYEGEGKNERYLLHRPAAQDRL